MFNEIKEVWKMSDVFLVPGKWSITRDCPAPQGLKAHTPCLPKKRPSLQARSLYWLGVLALLVILAGCGITPSTSNTQPANSTPLSLPPQSTTATPTTPASTSADSTTYH